MDSHLVAFPAYRESGVTWLGRVPEHWSVLPNRSIYQEIIERNRHDEEMLSVTIRSGVIPQTELLADSSKKDSSNIDRSGYKLVQPGDVVYNKMRAWQGAIGVSRYRGIVSPAYIVERFREKQVPEYFHYLYRIPAFATEAERWSYGITSDQWSLRAEDFKQIYSCVPPLDEQAAIVKYLAHVDRKIDRFVRSKRRMIELLNEQKQAIIHQAVTKGLDPSVPMKDSGVEWLGEIPAHWDTARLKQVTSNIVDCLHATPVYSDSGEFPAIRTADIEPGVVHLDSARRVDQAHYEKWTSRFVPKPGDILYSREGERFGIAASVPLNAQLCISQRMMVFRVGSRHSSNYFMWQLNAPPVYAQAALDTLGAAAPHVNVETIKNLQLNVPPVGEQYSIATWIDEQLREVSRLMQVAKREIDLIREYRVRLVSDVVTGKRDIRGVELSAVEKGLDAEFDGRFYELEDENTQIEE